MPDVNGLVRRQVARSAFAHRGFVVILGVLAALTTFMYVFVQASIDPNMTALDQVVAGGGTLTGAQRDLRVALESNTSLALTFLVAIGAIDVFVLGLYHRQTFAQHLRSIGTLRALGIRTRQIRRAYVFVTGVIVVVGTAVGLAAGYAASGVLLGSYRDSYPGVEVTRGLHVTSVLWATVAVIAAWCVTTAVSYRACVRADPDVLIRGSVVRLPRRGVAAVADAVARALPSGARARTRTLLRRPIVSLMCVVTVVLTTTLCLFSVSLHLSGGALQQWQSAGRDYDAQVTLSAPNDAAAIPAGATGTRTVEATLTTGSGGASAAAGQAIGQAEGQAIGRADGADVSGDGGVEGGVDVLAVGIADGGLLELQDDAGRALGADARAGLVIGPDLADVYGWGVGDGLTVTLAGVPHRLVVSGVARNAELGSVYLQPAELSGLLGEPVGTVNGYLAAGAGAAPADATVVTSADRDAALDEAAVSNRMSAVINQVLAIVFGALLLVLVLLLSFQGATRDILILHLLGLRPRAINAQRVSIFRPVVTAGFVVAVPLALWFGRALSRLLSVQTGDYIPFQTNVWAILAAFVGIQLIYAGSEALFTGRIRRILRDEATAAYL